MIPVVTEGTTGWLHPANGRTGILILPGGGQTRVGPHRLFVRIAQHLSARGYSVLRIDRTGIGDSDGLAAHFEEAREDLSAARAAFRDAAPSVERFILLGHCDGATAAALSADLFDGLLLLNPWVIEDEDEALPAAAARAHYLRRLTQPVNWVRLLRGKFDLAAAFRSAFARQARQASASGVTLADRVMQALGTRDEPAGIILSDRDRTAQVFSARAPKTLSVRRLSADHAFSRPDEIEALLSELEASLPTA